MPNVGIDDIAIHFPRLYFDMEDFAKLRGADFGKLNRGLGLAAMAIPDVHEDTATICLLYTSPSPRDVEESRMPSSA